MYAAKLNVRNAYLDPNLICEASHARPLLWPNSYPAFTGAKGQAREAIRNDAHNKARYAAAIYIKKAF